MIMAKLFDELTALKEAYDTKLAEEGEEAVKELFKEFFDKYPRAETVTWNQYTPYFNDGDPCYFSVGEMTLELNEEEEDVKEDGGPEDEDEEDDDEDYDDEDEYEHSSYSLNLSDDPVLKQMGEDFGTLEGIPDDVLEHVFGDHVKITATRDGFRVTEYSHD